MKKIIDNVYLVGNSGCSVYLVDTNSDDGLILIDCGMDIDTLGSISYEGFSISDIKHVIITHCHIDHIAACPDLMIINPEVKFYAHELDAKAIEEKGHNNKTAASWYGINYEPIQLFKRFTRDLEQLKFGNYIFKCIHTPGHTPGSISVMIEIQDKKILFGQDIHGPFYDSFGSNLKDYQNSMQKLLDLEPDILCEGHFGIIQPAHEVRKYIENYMNTNKP